ncbi:MAG: RraA family protein [Lachnospiraceae bacterium]|nr:RraA family protein [Lachnospiraceae bacterium]
MNFCVKEDILQLTREWKGERFDDGRPRVPDEDIEELGNLTQEQIWEPLWNLGYKNLFESHLYRMHEDERKLLGRAVTAAYMPSRPDLFSLVEEIGFSEGRRGTHNLWVVDRLVKGDCIVIDMYDKIFQGTFVGGNLSTAIKNNTETGGAVIWGGIRDIEQIQKIPGYQVYYRGNDPTPIKDFVMTSFNGPVRIGAAVCLPGDIVYGYKGGVFFVPSHLVRYVIGEAKKPKAKDLFGFRRLKEHVYTTSDIDRGVWPVHMLDELTEFLRTEEEASEYRDLDWSNEYAKAKEFFGGDGNEQPGVIYDYREV